jgi:hypothetical protein
MYPNQVLPDIAGVDFVLVLNGAYEAWYTGWDQVQGRIHVFSLL